VQAILSYPLLEQAFLDASKAREARQLRQRRMAVGASIAAVGLIIAVLSSWLILQQRTQATFRQLRDEAAAARDALQPDEAIAKLTQAHEVLPGQFELDVEIDGVNRYVATEWQAQAEAFKERLEPEPSLDRLEEAQARYPDLFDYDAEAADVRRYVATYWTQEGEQLAREGDSIGAREKFTAALQLDPPPDTLVYVWIPPGEFTMGSTEEDELAQDDEMPQHTVHVDGFWIRRTEVTNAQ